MGEPGALIGQYVGMGEEKAGAEALLIRVARAVRNTRPAGQGAIAVYAHSDLATEVLAWDDARLEAHRGAPPLADVLRASLMESRRLLLARAPVSGRDAGKVALIAIERALGISEDGPPQGSGAGIDWRTVKHEHVERDEDDLCVACLGGPDDPIHSRVMRIVGAEQIRAREREDILAQMFCVLCLEREPHESHRVYRVRDALLRDADRGEVNRRMGIAAPKPQPDGAR